MNTESTLDLVHDLRQVLAALDRMVRGSLRGKQQDEWLVALRPTRKWEPLYEEVDLAEMNPAFTRAQAIDLLGRITRELDLIKCQLDNYIHSQDGGRETQEEIQPVVINHVVDDVVGLFRWKAESRGIAFVQEGTEPLTIRLRPHAFRRALVNVVDNAVKYSFEGTASHPRHIKCLIKRHSNRGDCKLEVESFGVGILPGENTRVFERGYRSQKALDEKRDGSGLGLYEAKRIVEDVQGEIYLSSAEQHEGAYKTTVTMILPARPM